MILRYADILLMYAEAKNELNELDETVWNETVRPIRTRAGFTAESALEFPGKDQEKLRAVIRYERRAEFAGEGYYYNDLRRCKALGKEYVVMTNPKNVNGSSNRWPLRLPYGNSGVSSNANVRAAYGDGLYVFTEPVWVFGGTR